MAIYIFCWQCGKETSITNKIGVKKFVNPVCVKCEGTNFTKMDDLVLRNGGNNESDKN